MTDEPDTRSLSPEERAKEDAAKCRFFYFKATR